MRPRDVAPASDWEFDFSVSEDDGGEFIVEDAQGKFVCVCNTEDNALSVAGALNQAWEDGRAADIARAFAVGD
jgi:hypothetical protein